MVPWVVVWACATPTPVTPGKSVPAEQKDVLGLELDPESDRYGALVAGAYRARIRLVDTHGKVFDLNRPLEVEGLSAQQSNAFDAALGRHLIEAIPGAPADLLPTLLVILSDLASRADLLKALPAMKRVAAKIQATTSGRVRRGEATTHGAHADVLPDLRATLESKGHLPMKTVDHAVTTWTGETIESPERVLACEHPLRVCQ